MRKLRSQLPCSEQGSRRGRHLRQCGGKLIIRKDDKPETIKDRLAVYHEQTAPLADYYRKAGKLFTVDGTQEISAITAQLFSILEA